MFKPDGRSTKERGYGPTHIRTRKEWEPIVAAGGVICWRCGRVIVDGKVPQAWRGSVRMVSVWHLGHNDARTGYKGPEHWRCSIVAGARSGARKVNATPKRRAAPHKRPSGVYGPLSS